MTIQRVVKESEKDFRAEKISEKRNGEDHAAWVGRKDRGRDEWVQTREKSQLTFRRRGCR